MKAEIRVVAVVVLGMAGLLALGQADDRGRSVLKGAAVEYLFPEQVTLAAGKASDVELHFRVAPGLHINSHAPKDEFLIPTTFSVPEDAGVRLEVTDYPAGEE